MCLDELERQINRLNTEFLDAYLDFICEHETAEEIQKGCYAAELIFSTVEACAYESVYISKVRSPLGKEDAELNSQLQQAISAVQSGTVLQKFGQRKIDLVPALGILKGLSLDILCEQAIIADPMPILSGHVEFLEKLPDPHHDLADYAFHLAVAVDDLRGLLSYIRALNEQPSPSDARFDQEELVYSGSKIMFIVMNMQWNWHLPNIKRGAKLMNSARRGHEAVHGTSAEKQSRRRDMLCRWDQMHKAKPYLSKDGIDQEVAKEFEVHAKTVQRARLRMKTQES